MPATLSRDRGTRSGRRPRADEVCGLVGGHRRAGARPVHLAAPPCTRSTSCCATAPITRSSRRVKVDPSAGKAFVADERLLPGRHPCFWHGGRRPRRCCVLVVIDRLPFTRPDDPLAQAPPRGGGAYPVGGASGMSTFRPPRRAGSRARSWFGRTPRPRCGRRARPAARRPLGYRDAAARHLPPMRRVVDGALATTSSRGVAAQGERGGWNPCPQTLDL